MRWGHVQPGDLLTRNHGTLWLVIDRQPVYTRTLTDLIRFTFLVVTSIGPEISWHNLYDTDLGIGIVRVHRKGKVIWRRPRRGKNSKARPRSV